LFILTRDLDYIASFGEAVPNMFLVHEWRSTKDGSLHLYKGIKRFAQLVDDTIIFDFNDAALPEENLEKDLAISNLAASASFSWTHSAIAKPQHFKNELTEPDVENLLEIAITNNQVGGIMSDDDLHQFYSEIRFKLPIMGNAIAEKFDSIFDDIIPF
jgi:hypothetical protein